MKDKITFNYFYSDEADMLNFYRIPKLLFTNDYFKTLSTEAKVLYGLMLDRMSLSIKNKWFDKENRAYIYFSVEDTMEFLNCGKNKAIDTIKELDVEAGIGLIEKKRQGQGKPTIIYVKSFMVGEQKNDCQDDNVSDQKFEKPTSETVDNLSEVGKTNFKTLKISPSKGLKKKIPEIGKRGTSNTKGNYTEGNDTNLILSSIVDNGFNEYNAYSKLIKRNLDWDILCERYSWDKEQIEGFYDIILETLLCKNDTICISGNKYPVQLVKSKFLKLNCYHIEYVIESLDKRLKENAPEIDNLKQYKLAMLFNAPSTINAYYGAKVNHDMQKYAGMKSAVK